MKFIVSTPKANPNQVVNVSNSNPTEGWVIVKAVKPTIKGGKEWENVQHSALFKAPLDRLRSMQGLVKGADFEAIMKARGYEGLRIVVKDTYEPQYFKANGTPQEPRKRSAENGGAPILSVDGRLIYRSETISDLSDTTENVIIPVQRTAVNAPAVASVASAVEGELA